MKLTEKLLYNSIALYHINKKGGEMLKDLNKVLSKENLTASQLLEMSNASFIQTNANEVLGTAQVGFGQEFVQNTILSNELIERLRLGDSLLVDATIKLMTNKSMNFPVRWGRLRMTLTTENVNAPTGGAVNPSQIQKAGTVSINLTAKEMKITVYYSDTWLEDSVISVAEYVLQAITDAYDSSIHEILINGDVATGLNANINIIDGNTTALPQGAVTDLLLADGWRKLAFTNLAVVDALANFVISNLRTARASMGVKWLDPKNLRLVPDIQSYTTLMNMTQVETMEKFGDTATIKNGVLTAIDGVKIVNREEMTKTLATGKHSVNPALNIKGSMLVIHTPSILVWIRRDLTTETSRYAEDGVTGITGTARIAVTIDNTQNNISPTSPASLIVNI